MYDHKLETPQRERVTFGSLLGDRPTAAVFVRHPG
ncbi:hypothetical protein ALCH109712_11800 [Alkalicoccus chagannorensis]